VGKVPYGGVGIYDCETVGDIAITFDDGPWDYTSDLLDMFAAYKAKATFFITGTNLHKGKLNDRSLPWASIIQRMAAEGHQIASHTWSHENFSQTTTTQARNQMIWNEIALNDILGYIPTYMRPPYSICPQSCQKLMADLGYHIVYFDLDTEGYLHTEPNQIQRSRDIWDAAVEGTDACETGYLQIEHDIHYQVVYNLTGHILGCIRRTDGQHNLTGVHQIRYCTHILQIGPPRPGSSAGATSCRGPEHGMLITAGGSAHRGAHGAGVKQSKTSHSLFS